MPVNLCLYTESSWISTKECKIFNTKYSIKTLANFYDIDWHTIKELEKKYLQKRFSGIQTAHVKAIGIDEIHIGKGIQNQLDIPTYQQCKKGGIQ